MNTTGRSRFDEKSVDNVSTSMINTYDLAGLEEMDPSLSIIIFK